MAKFTDLCKATVILSIFVFAACTGVTIESKRSGVYHRVKKGETIYKIAQAYKINAQYLAEVNNIENIEMIEAGRVLFIPDAQYVVEDITSPVRDAEAHKRTVDKPDQSPKKPPPKEDTGISLKAREEKKTTSIAKELSPSDKKKPGTFQEKEEDKDKSSAFPKKFPLFGADAAKGEKDDSSVEEQKKIGFDRKRFVWPIEGKIISKFGIQPNGMFFNGVKIAARGGSPVVAAAAGTVIFSAYLKDYGETVILKHDDGYATVYSNLGEKLVKKDDHIKKSDRIGTAAKSDVKGEVNSSVHFEIRHNNKARNPLFFLP